MKVVGGNFKRILVKKNKDVVSPIKINTNIEIKDIRQTELDFFKGKDLFTFDYLFKIVYEPDFAEIEFEGGILILIEDQTILKDILKEWKNKQVPEDIKFVLMNIIFNKCNLKALQLEEDVGLPPHLPSPQIKKPEKASGSEKGDKGKGKAEYIN
jgi:hypothetical protein